MKIYVITVAKNFLANHPRRGQATNFEEKIKQGIKKHTIRGNFAYWNRIVNFVNSGKAVLSVRQWTGKPYNSKQIELYQFTKLSIQKVHFKKDESREKTSIEIDGKIMTGIEFDVVARNDGFEVTKDFIDWFPAEMKGCIIHFSIDTPWVPAGY